MSFNLTPLQLIHLNFSLQVLRLQTGSKLPGGAHTKPWFHSTGGEGCAEEKHSRLFLSHVLITKPIYALIFLFPLPSSKYNWS